MTKRNTRRGFTQLNKNVVLCPPCGESTLKGGKGVVNKETFMDNPPSARCATSPTLGGKAMRRGFTLIELLVVVLIIGILAAVALPQYQKAVWKARSAEAVSMVDSLQKAIEVYALENGEPNPNVFTDLKDKLDIEFSCPSGSCPNRFSYSVSWEDQDTSYGDDPASPGFNISAWNRDTLLSFIAVRYAGSTSWKRFCQCTTDMACSICEGYQTQGWQMDDMR